MGRGASPLTAFISNRIGIPGCLRTSAAGAAAAREEGRTRVVEAMSWSQPPCKASPSAATAEEEAAEVVVVEGAARADEAGADEAGAGEDGDAGVAKAAAENLSTRDACADSRFQ